MTESKLRVLLVSSNFDPEETGIAVYSTDLVTNILKTKYEVSVLTGLPHYPWWKIPEKFAHIKPGYVHTGGYEVFRVSHSIPQSANAIGRVQLEYSFWRNGLKQSRKFKHNDFDVVVAIMPTLACGLIARHYSRKYKVPGIVIFQDVTSLATLQSGMPGARFMYSLARILEIFACGWADKIITVSEEMARVVGQMIHKTVPIEVIHNYSVITPTILTHELARSQYPSFSDKYLILHTGNIGYKQDLLNVAAAAKILESYSDVQFLILGDGNQKSILAETIIGCKNISIIPFVSKEEYPVFLAASDALLVNERSSLKEMSLPSKLTSYLVSGRPVIAAVSSKSATNKSLGDNALIVEPSNPQSLADAILALKSDSALQAILSQRAKKLAEEKLSKATGKRKYLDSIYQVLSTK